MDWLYQQISTLVSQNSFLQGGLVLGALASIGYQLKAIPQLIWTKARYYATYTVHFDESSDFYRIFTEWLDENYPAKLRNVEVRFQGEGQNRYDSSPQSVKNSKGQRQYRLRRTQHSDSNVIFHCGRWLWISKDRARLDGARDVSMMFYNSYTITGFFAKSAIDDLCRTIEARKNLELEADVLQVYYNANDYFQNREVSVIKGLEHIFFEGKDELLADLKGFLEKKDVYAKKGIKYKRSYLFYGPGGTGKTSLGLAIAKHLGYDLYVINLAGIKNDLDLQNQAPRIEKKAVVLLEDIDCVLADRKVTNKKLNFSTVLNFLDGLYAPSDCIFVLTTNKPETLDSALTRKGRVDLSLLVDFPLVKDVEAFMSDFYEEPVRLIDYVPGFPGRPSSSQLRATCGMSEIQDICLRNKLSEAVFAVLAKFGSDNLSTNGKAPKKTATAPSVPFA